MNCQELGRILDEQELRWLPAAERAAAEAHLAGCPDCARDHQLDLRLAALPIPPLAPQSLAGWRALANSTAIGRNGRARTRFIVIGVAAVLAAAAAILGWYGNHAPEQPVAELRPAPAATSTPVAPQPEPPAVASQPAVVPALPTHTVQVRLQTVNVEDAELRAAIDQSYAYFVNELRAGPQLVIVPPGQSADFRVTYLSAGPTKPDRTGPDRQWLAYIGVEAAERNLTPEQAASGRQMATAASNFWVASLSGTLSVDGFAMVYGFQSSGRFEPGCAPDISASRPETVCSFVASALNQAETVRLLALPADAGLERQLQQRVGDGTVPWQQRYASIQLLSQIMEAQVVQGMLAKAGKLEAPIVQGMLPPAVRDKHLGTGLDQSFLRGALDLIAATPDAGDRAKLWHSLKGGLDRKGPVHLLIEAVPREPDERARLVALDMLVIDFPDDPQVRAALREMAITDASDLVRNAARQAAGGGDAEVREFAIATVKNASLPPARRLQPLAAMTNLDQFQDALGDEDTVQALLEILPILARDENQTDQKSVLKALAGLGNVKTTGVVNLLLAVLRATDDVSMTSTSYFNRAAAIGALALHRDDPRAFAELQKIASSDANSMMRQAAKELLDR